MKHFYLVLCSGLLWLFAGFSLLMRGLKLLTTPPLEGAEERVLLFLSVALLIGFFKGRFVLSKSARRVVQRIISLPEPVPITQVYGKGYLILIAGMISLGFLLKWLHLPHLTHGAIDVAIGSALMFGSFIYFRAVLLLRQEKV